MVGMSGECSAGRVLNRLDWCESFNPMFCIKCRLIRQWIDGWNVLGCSVIYGHRLISGPKEFIYLILTPAATYLTHLTFNENLKVLHFETLFNTRSLGALRAPTSSWRPFGPLDFVLRALRAIRPCDPRKVDQHLLFHLVDARIYDAYIFYT